MSKHKPSKALLTLRQKFLAKNRHTKASRNNTPSSPKLPRSFPNHVFSPTASRIVAGAGTFQKILRSEKEARDVSQKGNREKRSNPTTRPLPCFHARDAGTWNRNPSLPFLVALPPPGIASSRVKKGGPPLAPGLFSPGGNNLKGNLCVRKNDRDYPGLMMMARDGEGEGVPRSFCSRLSNRKDTEENSTEGTVRTFFFFSLFPPFFLLRDRGDEPLG